MHEPGGMYRPTILLLDLALVKPVAIEPEAQAVLVLDAEIVAGQRGALRPPPFHGDALGPFGAHHGVGGAAPDEASGRAVRHLGDHLDFLRPLEQAQGPQRWLAVRPFRPDRLRSVGETLL